MLPLRRSLLSLPPSLRTSLYQSQQSRSFSASTPRKSPLSDAILYCPTLLLDTIHSTGLPWHTTLPLSALLIRTLLVYHISTLPARKAAITRANLHPLSAARFRTEFAIYSQRIVDKHIADARAGRPFGKAQTLAANLKLNVMRTFMAVRSSHRLGKEFGAPVVSWWRSPVNLGVLVAMTEAVRVKCGAREGLLSFLIQPVDRHVDAEAARKAAMSPDEIMVERLEAAYAAKQEAARVKAEAAAQTSSSSSTTVEAEPIEGSQELMDQVLAEATADQLPALNTNTYAGLADPSLKSEGIAWFPDLTLADSTLLLPMALSGTMALTILLRPKTNPTPSSSKLMSKTAQKSKAADDTAPEDPLAALQNLPPPKSPFDYLSTGQKLGLSMSLVFFLVAIKLPVAVLLYLIPSMAIGWLQSRWLDLRYPLPEVVRACRRPVRMKVKKEFGDA